MTQWTDWTNCRGSCSELGHRTQTRTCQNGCDVISQDDMINLDECEVTEEGFLIADLIEVIFKFFIAIEYLSFSKTAISAQKQCLP